MRLKLVAACAVVSLTVFSAIAGAQTAPNSGGTSSTSQAAPGAAALAETDKAIVPVWPKTATKLPDTQEAVATSFALGQIEGVKPELVAGVTANGYARRVAVQNQTIGQVLVMSVAKGDKTETISTEGLTAQFDATETSELFPEKSLTVEGSRAALISALEKLNATEAKEEKKSAGDDKSENAVGSNKSGNDIASSYKTPAATTIEATEDDPVITYETTTSGCNIRVDLGQEKAFVQNKVQTFTDGVLSDDPACSDSEISYPIKKSYLNCPDKVDIEAATAWAQFTLYYADDQGETHTVSECAPDEETPYTISESEAQCSIDLDFDAGTATLQSALIYTNRSGAIVQARGCQPSTLTPPITMTESAAACPLRHVYAEGKSYELSMWSYILKGVTYQAAPCTDDGRTFAHETIYTDATGAYVCQPITDLTGGTATLQSRKQITIDGVPQYITECTPDTASKAIKATTDGCMDPSLWTHDLAAAISYGQERFYFTKTDGTPYYVTSCQKSAVTYIHDHEIVGYQNHDEGLYAYPLMKVTIDVNGTPYTIKSSELLAGEQQIVYVPADVPTIDKQNGTRTDEACSAYFGTTRYEQWERPDTTIYEKAIGEGTPVGPTEACSSTTETASYWVVSVAPQAGTLSSYQQLISRTVKTNPVTHEVFTGSPAATGTASAESLSPSNTGNRSFGRGKWEYAGCAECGDVFAFQAYISPGGYYTSTPCGSSPYYTLSQSSNKYGYVSYTMTCGYSPATAHDWQ